MARQLSILMITHKRRSKAFARSHAMAAHLVQRGYQVSLMVIAEKRRLGIVEDKWDGVRIIETPDLLWGRLRSGWDLWDLINRMAFLSRDTGKYDLIHCFETRPATIYPAIYYCTRQKVPFITDWNDWYGRGGIIDVLRPKWYRLLFGWIETYYEEAFRQQGSGVTVISTALAERAAKLGISQDRICYIPGGIFPDLFPYHDKEECRTRLGFPLTQPLLGFSSTDSHLDLDMVMAALAIIVQKYKSTKLIITGRTGKSVIELAKRFGVQENIYLTGFLPFNDLPWYLGCADVFVLPFPDRTYNIGRWPNKIGDYMCLGRPTVSNPVGDIKPLFEKNAIGLLAEWNAEDFANKIIYLLENHDVSHRYGENARHIAYNNYDWNLLTGKLEEFYIKILKS